MFSDQRSQIIPSTFRHFMDKPALGLPILGHLLNLPNAAVGLGASMLPSITPEGSPAFTEALQEGAQRSWDDRPDINPWIKFGLNLGAGAATTGPVFGAGLAAAGLRSISGLGTAIGFLDDIPSVVNAIKTGTTKSDTYQKYWGN